jgi:membrane AbrB-like protein
MAAGGVADMALIARERGGDAAAVGIVHALRVLMTVAIVPILVVSFGEPGTVPDHLVGTGPSVLWLVPAFATAVILAKLLKKTKLPNPWLVAPMLLGIILGATGLLSTAVPLVAIIAAQILLGSWLGSQFRRELLVTLPRVAMAGIAVSLFMICAAFLGALVLTASTSLSLATAFLALAPAAVTEMAITAKAMHLDPEVVTGFHVMRIFIVCATSLLVFSLYRRIASGLARA